MVDQKQKMKIILLLAIICSLTNLNYAQIHQDEGNELSIMLAFDENNETLLVGIDNPIDITYMENQIDLVQDLTAVFKNSSDTIEIIAKDEKFYLKPDALGVIELLIETKAGIWERTLNVIDFKPEARMTRYGANHEGKLNKMEFTFQPGIHANVEGRNIYANCDVLNYEIVRISGDNLAERKLNEGGKFTQDSKEIIEKASSGDLFVFRNIMCNCPHLETVQRLNDMIFEIE